MRENCPAGRRCGECPYVSICGGCLEDACVHLRSEKAHDSKCLFCDLKGLQCSGVSKPPKEFPLAEPELLDEAILTYSNSNYPDSWEDPEEPAWPLLIPEVSDITETTSRLGVWPDEGGWANPFFDPIAWDMTGNLFDKVKGAPWVNQPDDCGERDWHEVLGPEKNWIRNILLIDRLPDNLAFQTPPTAIMVAYLNRLMAYHSKMLTDDDAPYPWIVTHGYPSYIDWPPAWHFNLGIRMIASLLNYLSAQDEDTIYIDEGAWYPGRTRQTSTRLPLPYVQTDDGNMLLFKPGGGSPSPLSMDWPRFPGIIPFIPGADTIQLTWFAKQLGKAGFHTFAMDALNTIAHENFRGLPQAVDAVRSAGAKRVLVYGPWPLHIPSEFRPPRGISYIASAAHMDLTDYPPRYWRKPSKQNEKKWKEIPSYKSITLDKAELLDEIETCDCPACEGAKRSEYSPQSIWRWGHLLLAGVKWAISVQDQSNSNTASTPKANEPLWYQGPSNTIYREGLAYPKESRCSDAQQLIKSLVFQTGRILIEIPNEPNKHAFEIRWGANPKLSSWADGFPVLED
jgi:hypothetical protein